VAFAEVDGDVFDLCPSQGVVGSMKVAPLVAAMSSIRTKLRHERSSTPPQNWAQPSRR
jgi:hypothetical protein